jgi:hypothetical protein
MDDGGEPRRTGRASKIASAARSKVDDDECRETPPPKKRGRSQKAAGDIGSGLLESPAESGEGRSKRRREAVNRFTVGPTNEVEADEEPIDDSEHEPSDHNNDFCFKCGEGGDLLCCDGCPNAAHKQCIGMKKVPKGNWFCEVCQTNSENPTPITGTPGPGVGETAELPSAAKGAAAKPPSLAAEDHGIYINARPDDSMGTLPFQSHLAAAERYALHCDFVAAIWAQTRSAPRRPPKPVSFAAECSRLQAELVQLNEGNCRLENRLREML